MVGLRYLDEDNERRRALATSYEKIFGDHSRVELVPTPPGLLHARHLFQVLVEDRENVIAALQAEDVYPGVHYAINTAYAPYRAFARPLPRSERFCDRVISLPLHLNLSDDDIQRIGDITLQATRASSAAQ